jgi:hypothetical protein
VQEVETHAIWLLFCAGATREVLKPLILLGFSFGFGCPAVFWPYESTFMRDVCKEETQQEWLC